MSPERFRIEELYHAAREGTPKQRATLLAHSDPDLRLEVEFLLARRRGDEFLDRPAIQNAPELLEDCTVARLTPGVCLGPYRIESKLGEGGMGEVFRAIDTRLDRAVAIKITHERFSARFDREARAISSLNHPNVCALYDVGPNYLVMEYIEGAPLQGPLPVESALVVALQIVAALEAAHAKGITHRDIKPGNILVAVNPGQQPRVTLLDFGIAKVEDEGAPCAGPAITQTGPGAVLGTAAYTSPEQASGHTVDARSDIFSFGAVLYEMLTGRRAFEEGTWASTIAAVLHKQPEPFEAPPDLERAVRRCLRKSPTARFQTATELKAALEAIDVAAQRQPSIAVLPFANMSGDKEQEYFSDGLAEEILNALAQIPGLKVIARTSSFAFKGQNMDVRRVAAELGVTNILEGSVRRAGDRVRVTAQLIAASDGSHVWSQRYDRLLADVFAIQDELAEAIATALKSRLATDVRRPQRYAPKLPAYELFLKAMHHYAKYSRESAFRCKDYLEQALALDSHFALAHAMLGECFIEFAVYSSMPALEAATRARSSAQRALDLDPSVAEAHEVLARAAAALDYDWKECEREFQLAMSREPISPRLRWSYAHNCLLAIGHLKECERELNLALEDDPINALSRFSLALCFHSAGRLAEAEEQFRQVLELDAHFVPAAYWLVRNHAAKGAIAEALALAESLLPLAPLNPEVIGGLAGLLMRSGKRKRAGELLDRLGDGTGYGAPLGFLSYYFLLGESERAAEWMGKAIDERHVLVPLYVRTPLARSLLQGPDWPPLALQMNLGADR